MVKPHTLLVCQLMGHSWHEWWVSGEWLGKKVMLSWEINGSESRNIQHLLYYRYCMWNRRFHRLISVYKNSQHPCLWLLLLLWPIAAPQLGCIPHRREGKGREWEEEHLVWVLYAQKKSKLDFDVISKWRFTTIRERLTGLQERIF